MRRLFLVCAVTSLLVTMAAMAWAATTVKSSKSNSSERVLVYTGDVVSQAQATAILVELDKAGRTVGAGQVMEIIKRLGIPADRIKKISIPKPNLILLLADPKDEARALAVSDPGAPGDKPKTK